MNDMAQTIIPKSDQLNADDLIAGPRTIRIRDVKIALESEQPVAIYFDGDNNKPYLPCKSMRRVLVAVWGRDASVYTGRSMTIFRDPEVTFGGMAVGGVRISHMSHLTERTIVVLSASKSKRKPFLVLPLVIPPDPVDTAPPPKATTSPQEAARTFADGLLADIVSAGDENDLHDLAGNAAIQKKRDRLKAAYPEMDQEIAQAFTKRFNDFIIPSGADAEE